MGAHSIGGYGHLNFLKNSEDIQESLGHGGDRAQWRDKKLTSENAGTERAKTNALSDALYKMSTPPSIAVSNLFGSDNPRSMTALTQKKLDHNIRKAEFEAIVNLRSTLPQQVVRPPHFVPFPVLSSYICRA